MKMQKYHTESKIINTDDFEYGDSCIVCGHFIVFVCEVSG